MNLKRITPNAIPAAIERANRYRLLNEPMEAESICRDVLEIDPGHQGALKMLILALTDQFGQQRREHREEVAELLTRLATEYDREYLAGVVAERAAKSMLTAGNTSEAALDKLTRAMAHFDRAIALAEQGNDEAVLRWNSCVRLIARYGLVAQPPAALDAFEPEAFDDEVPER
ncbi:MAG: hypothetical protein KF866_05905 [Phycisphaeraceae bacterium]|nr:hypothetical protein [Phycisphaeraceae bacterium]MCW5754529.1 hypothetical protein [Phycisphaeraceae bacterium]